MSIFELQAADEVSGKARIKMSALMIHEKPGEVQKNGINWYLPYVEAEIESAKTMHYVVSWYDEEKQIPHAHGEQELNEFGELAFKDSVVVGNVTDAYIETQKIDGKDTRVLMTEGYINTQRYNKFYHWLKDAIKDGTVYGSVEFRGKGGKQIVYEGNADRTTRGRRPMVFDFSDLCIMHLKAPADRASQVFEINNEQENPKGGYVMDDKQRIVEMQGVIKELTAKITQLEEAGKLETQALLEQTNAELKAKVDELTKSEAELNEKLTEVTAAFEKLAADAKKAEANAYLENIKTADSGFLNESEINELKAIADTGDMDGLISKHKDIVFEKYRAQRKEPDIEINELVTYGGQNNKRDVTDSKYRLY